MANTKIPSELIADSAITAAKLADGTITTADIADSNVTTAKIADSNVTTAKIGDAQVTTAKIVDANVTTAKIADSNVTTAKILDNNITSAKLASALTLSGNTTFSGNIGSADIEITSTNRDMLHLRRNSSDGDAGINFENTSGNLGQFYAMSTGNFFMDASNEVILDSSAGIVRLYKDGGNIGAFQMNNNDFYIRSMVSDKDIIFQGYDGLSNITALTLDMSNAGRANFNNDIGLNDGRAIRLGSNDDGAIYNDGSNTYIKNTTNNHDIIFQGNDDGSAITALTLDMSNAGYATFNSGVILDGSFWINDGASSVGYMYSDSNDFVIRSYSPDKDIIFKGNDSNSIITALTLDMSAAGKATFNSDVVSTGIDLNENTSMYATDASLSHYSSSNGVYLNGAGTNGWLRLNASGVSNNRTSIDLYGQNQGDYIKFRAGNVDVAYMNLAGNLGIGEPSPQKKLHVDSGSANVVARFESSDSIAAIEFKDSAGTAEVGCSGSDLVFFPAGAEKARITSSGNLKFTGTTTNFEAPGFTYHTNNYLYLRGGSSGLILADDANHNTVQIVDGSGGYINFETSNGASRMRILSTGEVHITSAGVPISPTVKHSGATGDVSKLRLINRAGQAADKGGLLELGAVTNDGVDRSDVLGAVAGLKKNSTSGDMKGYLQFSTNNGTSLTERMRINENGSLMIGSTTNPPYPHKLYASGNAITNGTAFFEDTDGSCGLANVVLKLSFSNDTDATNASFIYMTDANSVLGSVGAASGTSVNFSSASDERLKENIVDASSQLDVINNIQIREFDWKSNNHHELGLIAQEINTIVPDVVREGGDNVAEHPWSIDYGKLTPYIIKAMQEQQQIIEDLKSRIETLES